MATAAPFSLINGISGSKSFEFGLVQITQPRRLPSKFVWQKKAKLYGHVSCRQQVSARAEYNGRRESGGGDFLSGFLLGGVVFGALGFLFAPQISKTLWSGDEDGLRKKLARRMDDDEGLEKTRKTLNEKIAQLNSAIDDVSAQLRAADGARDSAPGASEVESAA